MSKLEQPRHELFARCVAQGNSPMVCYANSGYRRNHAVADAMTKVPEVTKRIVELQALFEATRKLEEEHDVLLDVDNHAEALK